MAIMMPAYGAKAQAPASMPADLVEEFVVGNRILFDQGIIIDGFGHLSVRSPADPTHFYMSRARGAGLVVPDDIIEFDSNSTALNPGDRRPFSERWIHGEIYRTRPDVMAVVHTHAPSVIPFGVTGVPLRPILHMAGFLSHEIPVFEIRDVAGDDSNMLIQTAPLGAALAKVLGQGPVVLMRGHGMTVVGKTIRQAVSRSIYTDVNARAELEALKLGSHIVFLTEKEGANIAAVNDASINRSWEIWKQKALQDTPKFDLK